MHLLPALVSRGGPGSWLWCTRAADRPCQRHTACNRPWRCGRSRAHRCQTDQRAACWGKPCGRRRPPRWPGCSSSGLFRHTQTWSPGCSSRGFWPLLTVGSLTLHLLGCWCLDPRVQMPLAPLGHLAPGPLPHRPPRYSCTVTNEGRNRFGESGWVQK